MSVGSGFSYCILDGSALFLLVELIRGGLSFKEIGGVGVEVLDQGSQLSFCW